MIGAVLLIACLAPQEAPRAMRAAWVATVDNIDWPSKKGLPVAEQQRELTAILDCAQQLRLNTLILQVRPECDAIYPSKLEPWSEYLTGAQGRAPSPAWDPLAAAIEGAHARGIELHAWFNPYRARAGAATSKPAKSHVSQTNPSAVVGYGANLWCDPGNPVVQRRALAVIEDVLARYDVDGVHLDDYFYPYPEKRQPFPDGASFRRYRAGGGKLALADWRRHNVDEFIAGLYATVKKTKPWVKVGISPFGIARPGVPKGIAAGIDQYDQLYADVPKWLRSGWCDYLAPQLYWPIEQKAQSYPVLLGWWIEQNQLGRLIVPGIFTSKHPQAEIVAQVARTAQTPGASGIVHFSMRSLLRDRDGITTALREGAYAQAVLPPRWGWLDQDVPPAPVAQRGEGGIVSWQPVASASLYAVYARRDGKWSLAEVLPRTATRVQIQADAVLVRAVDRCGNESR